MGQLLRSGVGGELIKLLPSLWQGTSSSVLLGDFKSCGLPPLIRAWLHDIPTGKTRSPSGTERSGLCTLAATLPLLCDLTSPVSTSNFCEALSRKTLVGESCLYCCSEGSTIPSALPSLECETLMALSLVIWLMGFNGLLEKFNRMCFGLVACCFKILSFGGSPLHNGQPAPRWTGNLGALGFYSDFLASRRVSETNSVHNRFRC